ncbi:MAG: hypothetical protein M1503_10945 [Thaumarchaeota archaeon]|nr:hypothetical protein [Nitrososphaerota archaeon]
MKRIEKPSSHTEVEGKCPLCGTVMNKTKSITHQGWLYSCNFPIYLCLSHYHGFFRWAGNEHLRFIIPDDLSNCSKSLMGGRSNAYADAKLVERKCSQGLGGKNWT